MKLPFMKDYLRIPQHDTLDGSGDVEKADRSSRKIHQVQRAPALTWTQTLPWILAIVLLFTNSYTWNELRAFKIDNAVYSPAQSIIQHKNVLFTAGVQDEVSPYQGYPTEENNRLWEELYEFGVDKIPKSEADLLHNRTSPIVKEPGYYVVILEVFHELHCLNMIRKRLYWNETSPPPDALSMTHMDHCVDLLRQSIMCSSDITPIPYAWYPKYQEVMPTMGITHTCRDFDAIRDWAKERRTFKFDKKDHVEEVVHVLANN